MRPNSAHEKLYFGSAIFRCTAVGKVFKDQISRPQNAGIFSKLCNDQATTLPDVGPAEQWNVFGYGINDYLSCHHNPATQNNAVRRKRVYNYSNGPCQLFANSFVYTTGNRIVLLDIIVNSLGGKRSRGAQHFGDEWRLLLGIEPAAQRQGHFGNSRCRRISFDATFLPAIALQAMGVHGNMAQFTGHAVAALVQPIVSNNSAAYAGAERKTDHILNANAGAESPFRKRGNGNVVTCRCREPKPLSNGFVQLRAHPSRKILSPADYCAVAIDKPRRSDAHADDVFFSAFLGDKLVDKRKNVIENF